MTLTRRMRPSNAAARAKSSDTRRVTEEKASGFVRTVAGDRHGDYHTSEREVDVLATVFDESNPPAYVKVSAGLTIATAPYESLRIDCSISVPVDRNRIEEGYQLASDKVAEYVAQEQTEWLGSNKHKKGGR